MSKMYNCLIVLACLFTVSLRAQTVTIGTGTSATLSTSQTATSLQSPYNSYYGYSYVQSLYLQNEINATGSITSISYYFSGTSLSSSDELKIYMGTVARSAFASTTDWEPLGNLTLVFDGTISGTVPGWVTINLTTPFAYNNTGNLLIAVDENKAGDNGTAGYRASNLGANRVIFYRSDATNPNPATPPTAGGRSSYVGNIQIEGLTLTGCQPLTGLDVPTVNSSTATANWNAPAGGSAVTQYNWELRTSGAAGSGATGLVSSGNVAAPTTTLNLTSLASSTAYTLHVRTDCGSSTANGWQSFAFNTPCAPVTTLPWTENFDALTTVGTTEFPLCWKKINGDWRTSVAATHTYNDPRSAPNYLANSWTATDEYIWTPGFQLTAGTSYDFSFWWTGDGFDGWTGDVFYNTDQTATGANQLGTSFITTSTTSVVQYVQFKEAFIPSADGVYYFAIRINANGTPYQLGFDDFKLEVTPTCAEPASILINTTTTTTTQVEWNAPASGSTPVNYQIYYNTTNTAPTAGSTPNVTGATSPTTLTGLTANTTYYVWVRSNCGGTDLSSWASAGSFTTLCNPVTTFPWTENFESVTLPAMAQCFTVVNNNNDADKWITYDTYGVGGGKTAGLYTDFNAGINDDYLVLPAMTLTGNQRFRFSVRARSTGEPNDYRVVLSTTGVNAGDFSTELKPLTTVSSTTHTNIDWIDLSSYTGTVYIAIHVPSGGADGYYLYVDDLTVENIPTCDAPTAILKSNFTNGGADIEWTPPATGSPVNYQIFYNTTNTAPTAGSTPNVTGATSPTTLTGLTANTTYYVWVRSNCGGTDVSTWAAGGSFTTLCNPVTTFPWTENFESVTLPAMAQCFTVIDNNNDGDKWITYDTYGVGGGKTAGLYTDFNAGANDDYLVLPAMTLTGNQRFRFSVRARSTGEPNDYRVVLSTTGVNAGDFSTELKPLTTVSSTTHTNIDWIDLSSYTGTVYIAIHVPSGGADGYYLYVDDLTVENIPTCDAPTGIIASNFTNAGADLEWTPPTIGSPASYQIYYSITNTPPTDASTPQVTGATSPTTLTGLNSSTTYYVWVRSFCGGTDVSTWTAGGSFTTLCTPITTLPWTENFDAITTVGTTNFPPCWKKENGDWRTSVAATHTYNDPRSAPNYLANSWTATNEYMWTPGFELTAGTSYDFSFWWTGDGYTGWTGDVVYNTEQLGSTSTPLGSSFITPAITSVSTYVQFRESFTPPATGTYYFAIRINANSTPYQLGFDDFKLEVSPTCGEPTAIIESNVTPTALQVDWTPPAIGSVSNYSWELRSSGAAGSGATGLVNSGTTASTTVNLTSLTAATSYTFYVRANCVSPDMSSWASKTVSTAPVNDDCSNAITVYKSTPVNGTTVGSNPSMPADACATSGVADDDVWYKFTADYSGSASIAVTGVSATLDVVIVAYSGTCGAFTSIGCADGPGGGGSETANLTGLNAGETYYFRVWSYDAGAANNGTFTVTVTGSALPVTLVNFRGEHSGSTNKLLWSTSTENNNRGFELERSSDGRNYSSIMFVTSKAENGNSTSTLNYSYNDVRPLAGNNYYRLKQIDNDGRTTISNVVLLSRKVSDITLSSAYPNPATRELNLVISSPKSEKVTIVVTDLTGKVLMQRSTQLVVGDNQELFNIQQLAAGTYFIKAVCANGCETAVQRFVKQ